MCAHFHLKGDFVAEFSSAEDRKRTLSAGMYDHDMLVASTSHHVATMSPNSVEMEMADMYTGASGATGGDDHLAGELQELDDDVEDRNGLDESIKM